VDLRAAAKCDEGQGASGCPLALCRRQPIIYVPAEIIRSRLGTLIMLLEPLLGGNKKIVSADSPVLGFIAALVAAVMANARWTSFRTCLIVDGFATFSAYW